MIVIIIASYMDDDDRIVYGWDFSVTQQEQEQEQQDKHILGVRILETPQIAWKDISCKFPGRVGSAGQQTAAAAFFATKRQQQHQQQGLLVKPGMAAAKLPDTHQPAEKKKETVS